MTDNFLRTISSGGDRRSQEAQSENCNTFDLVGWWPSTKNMQTKEDLGQGQYACGCGEVQGKVLPNGRALQIFLSRSCLPAFIEGCRQVRNI